MLKSKDLLVELAQKSGAEKKPRQIVPHDPLNASISYKFILILSPLLISLVNKSQTDANTFKHNLNPKKTRIHSLKRPIRSIKL